MALSNDLAQSLVYKLRDFNENIYVFRKLNANLEGLKQLSKDLSSLEKSMEKSNFLHEWDIAVAELKAKHFGDEKYVPNEEAILRRIANNRIKEQERMKKVNQYVKRGL